MIDLPKPADLLHHASKLSRRLRIVPCPPPPRTDRLRGFIWVVDQCRKTIGIPGKLPEDDQNTHCRLIGSFNDVDMYIYGLRGTHNGKTDQQRTTSLQPHYRIPPSTFPTSNTVTPHNSTSSYHLHFPSKCTSPPPSSSPLPPRQSQHQRPPTYSAELPDKSPRQKAKAKAL
jgi:hypothetical protein